MVTSSMLLGLLQFAGQSGKQGTRLALMVNWWNTLLKSFAMLVRLCDTGQVCIWQRFRRWWLRGWISCYMSPQDCWQNQLSSGQVMLQLEDAPWRGEGKNWKLPEDGVAPISWSCQVTNVVNFAYGCVPCDVWGSVLHRPSVKLGWFGSQLHH